MCPDPTLLVAYLDGTLFSRDVIAVDQHTSTCAPCAALLASMRNERVVAVPSLWRCPWAIAAASVVVAIVVSGIWLMPSGSNGALNVETPARRETAVPTTVTRDAAPLAPTTLQGSKTSDAPVTTRPPPRSATAATEGLRPAATAKAPPKPKGGTEKPRRAPDTPVVKPPAVAVAPAVAPVADPEQAVGGVTLRGRRANSRIVWRTRDLVVEHSTDAGATWVAEHTSDRPIRAGSFVDANVAWLVGENGLVLRRTKNGWFGTTPPAEGHINAVRASSPSKATLTFDDGRVFNTEDGGVTWSVR
ncbi:MAG TPA: hypothetical protein VI485_30985 [Vicinamibacterales bacterium]|nr:hypothetical protein [Vicinamibacterales bacterium]